MTDKLEVFFRKHLSDGNWPQHELQRDPCRGRWSEHSCPRIAAVNHSMVMVRSPKPSEERRTLHYWATVAQLIVILSLDRQVRLSTNLSCAVTSVQEERS